MAKHLAQITHKLKSYLHTDNHLQRSAKHTSQHLNLGHLPLQHNLNQQQHQNQQLPPALQLAILKGEALIRLRVFAYLANRGFDERFILLAYQKIFTDSMVISEFCQQIGLIEVAEDYITQGAGFSADSYQAVCWQLYCILVDRLDSEEKHQLVNNATVGLTHHYLPSFFQKLARSNQVLNS